MSDNRGSSHDEGELSDESLKRSHRASSSEETKSVQSIKESKMRESILSRMPRHKISESDDDTTEQRFSIQPKDAQKAKEDRYRDQERKRDRRDDRKAGHEASRPKEREFRGRHERSGRDGKGHEHRHRKHDSEHRTGRDRSSDRHGHTKKEERHRERHKRSRSSSAEEERRNKSPIKKSRDHEGAETEKLFDSVFGQGNYKKKNEEVVVVEDIEMSPVEILEEKTEVTHFTLDSPAGPKKYSKFESDPESDPEKEEKEREESPQIIEDDDDVEILEESMNSENEESDDGDDKYSKTPEDSEWEAMTETEMRLHKEAMKKRESERQKGLIALLPVFYPGLMGCRSIDEYECVNRIDEGTFGVVYRGKEKRTDEIVALKRLKMEKEKEGFPITALREINMLLKAGNHPNIVNVKEILVGSNMDKIYMAMEFVEHDMKSLLDTMTRLNKRFSSGEQKRLMVQLLSGINHMHKLWILHRDLKTSNLLMSHKGVLKIADFGLAREYGDPLRKFTSVVVTLWYRSPELLLGTKLYSTPVDMWSVGCIMAELILMKPLFPGRGECEQIKKIFMELGTPTETIWPGVTQLEGWKIVNFEKYPYNQLRKRFLSGRLLNDTGFKLLNGLLTLDPKSRLTAIEALGHEWFKEDPLPVPPEEFSTFPAKSEQHKAPPQAAKQKQAENRMAHVDPETAKLLKQFEVRPEQVKPGGFNLKFDPARF